MKTQVVVLTMLGMVLAAGAAWAQTPQPLVRAWGNYLVVTAPTPAATPGDEAVLKKLEGTVVSVSFMETPLAEAVEFLGTLGDVNLVVLKTANPRETGVTLKLKDVNLKTALNFLTEQVGLKWSIRDGVVVIGPANEVRPHVRTTFYDVTHLLAIPPDFVGPTISFQTASFDRQADENVPSWPGGPQQPQPSQPTEKSRPELMNELVTIVQEMLDARAAQGDGFTY